MKGSSCRYEAEIDGRHYLVIEKRDGRGAAWVPIEISNRRIPDWSEHLSEDVRQYLKRFSFAKDLRRIAWTRKKSFHEKPILYVYSNIVDYCLEYDWMTHLYPMLDALEYFHLHDPDIWPGRLDPVSLMPEALAKYRQFLHAESSVRLHTMAALKPYKAMALLDEWFHSADEWVLDEFACIGEVPLRIRAKKGGEATWKRNPSPHEISDLYDEYRKKYPDKTKKQLAKMMLQNEFHGRYWNRNGLPASPESLAKRFPVVHPRR